MQLIEPMARGFGIRRFASLAAALWLMAVLLPATPDGTNARCKAAGHHCPEMPALICCCGGVAAVAADVLAVPVTKTSLAPVQQLRTTHVAIERATAECDARARFCVVLPPSNAGPPLDRPVLYSTLLL